jgi:hypothetical protein
MFVSSRLKMRGSFCLAATTLALLPEYAAGDFAGKPFEARLLHALDRQSPYVATLGRQASLAYLSAGSFNPGAASWSDAPTAAGSLGLTYVDASSSPGNHVTAAPVTARWYSPAFGTAYATYAHTHTNDATGTGGLQQRLASDEYIAGYGRRVTDAIAIGASLRVTDASIGHDFLSTDLGGAALRATTEFVAGELNLGIAGRASDSLSFGLTGGVSRLRPTTTVQNVDPLAVPSNTPPGFAVIPSGTAVDRFKDTLHEYVLGAGIGYRLFTGFSIYSDIRAVRLSGGRTGKVDLARLITGFEHALNERWSWRGGVSLNSEGNLTSSVGLTYLTRLLEFQLAWQANAAPEVNREIGRTRLLAASIALRL